MSDSANVTSIEAIADFKGALLRFEEGAAHALSALQQEIYRALDWLENDRPAYWQEQIRTGHDKVTETRVNYERCRMQTVGGQRPACLEEKEAWRSAKQRLATAQEKLETVRRWTIKVHQEVDEYRGRIGRLQRCIETDVPQMVALLERMLDSLDAYASVSRPLEDDDETAVAKSIDTSRRTSQDQTANDGTSK